MELHMMPKNAEFVCEICDFKCCKKSNWITHVNTIKHIYNHGGNQMETAEVKKNADYICNCGKKYITSSGLWKHKKNCVILSEDNEDNQKLNIDEPKDKQFDLIMMLVKENASIIKENSEFKNMMMEQQNMMMEVIKNGTHNTMINNNTNSHNKAFNLNFFLNETCKNAMNITEFVDSIQLQLSDFENVGDIGFVNGISNIIVKNLKALDVTKRPVHCTDQKRETIYIKDDNKWEKEDDKNQKLRKVIKKVVSKNHRLILKFREVYPDYNKYSSPTSTRYDKIIIEAMGGAGDNDVEKEDKIIRNIVKNIGIEKESSSIL